MWRSICLPVWALVLLCLGWNPASATGMTHLIMSEEGDVYREVVDAFRAAYKSPRQVRIWHLADLDGEKLRSLSAGQDLLVPIGLKAARATAEHHGGQASVLTLMVPHVSVQRLAWPDNLARHKLSHVHIDQPASRSLRLVEAVFPRARRVGLVISAENTEIVKSIQQEAERRRLALKFDRVNGAGEVAGALRDVLPEVDVLLLLPDSIAFHAGNARNVLITTYRHRVPVVGFSRGLARAGAVAAVYSSPAQIGRQGASMAMRWKPETGELPPAQHADEFSISGNAHVARSLGVEFPDLDEVGSKLGASVEP